MDGFDRASYEEDLAAFLAEYKEKATPFAKSEYEGHMNWDVSKAHLDAFTGTMKYNQNIVAEESAPLACDLEKKFIEEFASDIGYPKSSWGYISSGGTISNIYGLWIARNKKQAKGKKPKYVLVADNCHYSIQKACDILGLRVKPLKKDVNIPPNRIAAVVCICGSTEYGSCDDILFWRQFCDTYDIHLHIDAAYGGYFVYCKDSEHLSEGAKVMLNNIPLSDSIAIDAHKLGYAPYAMGVCLIKNHQDVMYINSSKDVKYLGVTSTSLYTLEGSRPGSVAAAAYFGHKHLRPYYKDLLEANLIGAKLLREKIAKSEHFVPYEISDMGIVCFTSKVLPMNYLKGVFCNLENAHNNRIQLVTTTIDGVEYFRVCVMDPTFKDTIDDWWSKFESTVSKTEKNFNIYVEKRLNNILSIAEECDTKEELETLIRSGKTITAYNGFEPSGRIHIAQAIITVLNANLLIENGCNVKLYIADWFAKLNHKMGGDLEKIRNVGRYFIEVFKACGISRENLEFIWASELMFRDSQYWERVLDITTKTTYKRAIRCSQIMGRRDDDNLDVSQLLYPCMQVADIFQLGIDIPQLGLDQRKCNMLAREYATKIGVPKPVNVAHHMLMGLKGSKAGKMSKSIPDSAIFMEDSESEVNRKISAAFCNDEIEGNPIFEYIKYILIRWFKEIEIEGCVYTDIKSIESDFPKFDKRSLKQTVAKYINQILEPVRSHFADGEMKALKDLVASYSITR